MYLICKIRKCIPYPPVEDPRKDYFYLTDEKAKARPREGETCARSHSKLKTGHIAQRVGALDWPFRDFNLLNY